MSTKSTLIIITPTTSHEDLKGVSIDPQQTYTVFLPTRFTKVQEIEKVEALRKQLDIPSENHITINISSIVQKTWRIIKHYAPGEVVPEKNTPDRQKDLKRISELNQARITELEKLITDMVIQDQSTRLDATIINLNQSS